MHAEASGSDNQPHGADEVNVLDAYARRATGASTLDLLKQLGYSSERVAQLPEPVRNEMLLQANAGLDIQQSRKVITTCVLICACDA